MYRSLCISPFFHKQAFWPSCLTWEGSLAMQKSPIYVRTDIRKEAPMVLAIFWLAGILFGAACCYVSTEDTVSLMRGICAGPVSIVGVMNAVFVPFLLSVVFIMLSMKRMLMVL